VGSYPRRDTDTYKPERHRPDRFRGYSSSPDSVPSSRQTAYDDDICDPELSGRHRGSGPCYHRDQEASLSPERRPRALPRQRYQHQQYVGQRGLELPRGHRERRSNMDYREYDRSRSPRRDHNRDQTKRSVSPETHHRRRQHSPPPPLPPFRPGKSRDTPEHH